MSVVLTPHPSILEIRNDLGISREKMARVFDVSSKTIDRWEKQAAPLRDAHDAKTLEDLKTIVELGQLVWGEDGFRLFLTLPQPVLGSRTPLQALERGDLAAVLSMVAADYEGLGP
ncbi:MAG: hypothetical protein IT335_00920 [Thermomicrobiales bacterium]|jgi:DNA-binding XRE family transcriptional regulator|nr:hypothetical protein [Thermomicrobiales bacterium]